MPKFHARVHYRGGGATCRKVAWLRSIDAPSANEAHQIAITEVTYDPKRTVASIEAVDVRAW